MSDNYMPDAQIVAGIVPLRSYQYLIDGAPELVATPAEMSSWPVRYSVSVAAANAFGELVRYDDIEYIAESDTGIFYTDDHRINSMTRAGFDFSRIPHALREAVAAYAERNPSFLPPGHFFDAFWQSDDSFADELAENLGLDVRDLP